MSWHCGSYDLTIGVSHSFVCFDSPSSRKRLLTMLDMVSAVKHRSMGLCWWAIRLINWFLRIISLQKSFLFLKIVTLFWLKYLGNVCEINSKDAIFCLDTHIYTHTYILNLLIHNYRYLYSCIYTYIHIMHNHEGRWCKCSEWLFRCNNYSSDVVLKREECQGHSPDVTR